MLFVFFFSFLCFFLFNFWKSIKTFFVLILKLKFIRLGVLLLHYFKCFWKFFAVFVVFDCINKQHCKKTFAFLLTNAYTAYTFNSANKRAYAMWIWFNSLFCIFFLRYSVKEKSELQTDCNRSECTLSNQCYF